MRRWMLAALAGAAVTMATMPAQAAWKSYVNRQLGFSFMAPGEVKASVGNSRGNLAGPRQTIVYRSVEDNIEYKATVVSFLQAQAEGAALLGEREYTFQEHKKLLMDTFARVEPGKDAVYGRKMVVELPDNKGRATGAFYFTKGRLYVLEATVLPAHGDYGSPEPGRRRFNRVRAFPHGAGRRRAQDSRAGIELHSPAGHPCAAGQPDRLPAKSVPELVALADVAPGKLNIGRRVAGGAWVVKALLRPPS